MAKQSLKVYLDHHIKRENLLYRRAGKTKSDKDTLFSLIDAESPQEPIPEWTPLKLQELYGEESKTVYLRKPDFQRATWSWTPTECVDLLEALLDLRVVPSIIMWMSSENFLYVLDGGHRISVLLAWIEDDWGDRRAIKHQDPGTEEKINQAAQEVRQMLEARGIATYKEYREANARYRQYLKEGKDPKSVMSNRDFGYAEKMRHWINANVGFPILWVRGDNEIAEKSFLQINRTGQKLSDWQTKLVENRTSSFARTVMAIAHKSNPEYCWTTNTPEVEQNNNLKGKVAEILTKVTHIQKILFEPAHEKPLKTGDQPLLVIPYTQPEKQPVYVAEVLTIVEGKKGQKTETEKLIQKDSRDPVPKIIENGLLLVNKAVDVIGNVLGNTSRSLTLVPLVYFYTTQGIQVRSLFYGILYWFSQGTEAEIRSRKLLFTIHRQRFEKTVLKYKEDIVIRLSRRIGSGAEATTQAASYYNGLLQLLAESDLDIESPEFDKKHKVVIDTLGKAENIDSKSLTSASNNFSRVTKERNQVKELIENLSVCGICNGLYYPGKFTQVDHIQRKRDDGQPTLENARQTHPFCNHNRDRIEKIKEDKEVLDLPAFESSKSPAVVIQPAFSFLDDEENENELPEEFDFSDETT